MIQEYHYKVVKRPWGDECLFAVLEDNKAYNDVIDIKEIDPKANDFDDKVKAKVDARVAKMKADKANAELEVPDGILQPK